MPNTRKAPDGNAGDEDDVEGHGSRQKGPEDFSNTRKAPEGVSGNTRKATPGDDDDVEGHSMLRRGKSGE